MIFGKTPVHPEALQEEIESLKPGPFEIYSNLDDRQQLTVRERMARRLQIQNDMIPVLVAVIGASAIGIYQTFERVGGVSTTDNVSATISSAVILTAAGCVAHGFQTEAINRIPGQVSQEA